MDFHAIEELVRSLVQWLRLLTETAGALIIGVGMVKALWTLACTFACRRPYDFNKVRLSLAHYLALALEFQLAADILSTAIAPSWDQIGKLGAVAIIRTALNFFLMHEMRNERTQIEITSPKSATIAESTRA